MKKKSKTKARRVPKKRVKARTRELPERSDRELEPPEFEFPPNEEWLGEAIASIPHVYQDAFTIGPTNDVLIDPESGTVSEPREWLLGKNRSGLTRIVSNFHSLERALSREAREAFESYRSSFSQEGRSFDTFLKDQMIILQLIVGLGFHRRAIPESTDLELLAKVLTDIYSIRFGKNNTPARKQADAVIRKRVERATIALEGQPRQKATQACASIKSAQGTIPELEAALQKKLVAHDPKFAGLSPHYLNKVVSSLRKTLGPERALARLTVSVGAFNRSELAPDDPKFEEEVLKFFDVLRHTRKAK